MKEWARLIWSANGCRADGKALLNHDLVSGLLETWKPCDMARLSTDCFKPERIEGGAAYDKSYISAILSDGAYRREVEYMPRSDNSSLHTIYAVQRSRATSEFVSDINCFLGNDLFINGCL